MFVAACGDDTVQPPANQPPVAVAGISAQTVAVGDSLTIDLLAHFNDPDGDPLIFAAEAADKGVAAAAVSSGTLTIRAVAQGETTITATARDPGGLSASLTFSVVVPNRPPEVADSIPALELVAGDSAIVNLPTYFSDPDGDTLVFTAESADHGVATATVSEGTLTLRAVAQGATDVTVTARDPGEFSAMQTFAVTVPNRPPEVTDSIPAAELVTGDTTAIDLSAHFSDPDGDTLVFTAESADHGVATATVSESTLTLRGVARGATEVTVIVRDPAGLSAMLTFAVTVPNRPPEVTDSIPAVELVTGDSTAIDLPAHFSDPDGDTLVFTAEPADDGVATAAVSDGTLTVRAVAPGVTEIALTAQDPGGLSTILVFSVSVTNRAPVAVYPISTLVMLKDESRDIALSEHFSDPDGSTLSYTVDSSPAEVVRISVAEDKLMLTAVAAGKTEVTVTARDPGSLSASLRFEVTVAGTPDLGALIALYHATGGPYWDKTDNWLTDLPLDRWHGVETNTAGRVTGLDLSRNNLTGSIPAMVSRIEHLRRLRLSFNGLRGTIPPELGSLARLESLDLGGNHLSGSIPPELGRLAQLEDLSLKDNDLKGPIPSEFGALVNLRDLDLNRTRLTGSIPPELGKLTRLEEIRIFGADLSGAIPPELGNLRQLWHLGLDRNNLTGSIPPELGNLAKLRELRLARNELTGPLPPEIGRLDNLEHLFLDGNQLSGPIPSTLIKLDLGRLHLRNSGLCVPGTRKFVTWVNEIGVAEDPSFCNETDVDGLTALYEAAAGEDWRNSGGWGEGVVLDRWHGVATDTLGRVLTLDLSDNGLVGRLPATLGQSLGRLAELRISRNALSGPLPRSLTDVPLRQLHYADTDLCAPAEASFQAWLNAILSHDGTGAECALLTERDVLSAFYEASGGSAWRNSDNWRTDVPLGDWYGVGVDAEGRVISLDLRDNRLTGSIPEELGLLRHLVRLNLAANDLEGPIPNGLTLLTELEHLDLSSNTLTGAVAGELGSLKQLKDLNLGRNFLTGSIPSELGSLARLEKLGLFVNNLTGLIPPELGALTDLRILELAVNGLTGTIPPELGSLANLENLDLGHNVLTGPLPAELGQLAKLESLVLGSNQLTGTIPPALWELTSLQNLFLSFNRLTGSLPPKLGGLTNLKRMLISSNDLVGPIPPELGTLASLEEIWLGENRLSGSVPPELGALTELEYLDLRDNVLTGPIPGELGSLKRLRGLYLGQNDLSRRIPPQLGNLGNLVWLGLNNNRLAGPVPAEVGELVNLRTLDLSRNRALSGSLPGSMTNLLGLESLLTAGTRLCAPANEGFLGWLEGVEHQRVGRCVNLLSAAYLTQAVQSREFPVPLVAGEDALLRVFVTANRLDAAGLPPIRASFFLADRETYVVRIPGKTGPIPTEVNESSLSGSANARIPGNVLQPGLEMVIDVDPEGSLDPSLGVQTRIPEAGRLALDVRTMPALDITLIPFVWTEAPDRQIVETVKAMAANPQDHELLDQARTLLPVAELDVTAHEAVLTSTNNVYDLLRETGAIRAMEGGSGYYQGMMSGRLSGGASGVAGNKVNFSEPKARTIAHELGHNMSLSHAPCGGASRLDPEFPRADGAIGAWGYDFLGGGHLVDPSTRDLMSYCGPHWISDYHFAKALRARLAERDAARTTSLAAPTRSLLLWGGADENGVPVLEPAFVFDAVPSLPGADGDYQLDGTDADGRPLFSFSFDMLDVADGNGRGAFSFMLPARPEWAGDLASITLTGPGGSVGLDGGSDRPLSILFDRRTGRVRGILRDLLEDPRALADAAEGLASGNSLQVLFSRGIPDAAAWRH